MELSIVRVKHTSPAARFRLLYQFNSNGSAAIWKYNRTTCATRLMCFTRTVPHSANYLSLEFFVTTGNNLLKLRLGAKASMQKWWDYNNLIKIVIQ